MTSATAFNPPRIRSAFLSVCLALAALAGCGDDDDDGAAGSSAGHDGGAQYESDAAASSAPDSGEVPVASDSGTSERDAEVERDGGALDAGEQDAGEQDAALPPPLSLGGMTVNMSRDEQTLDLFGSAGHRFWIELSDEQLHAINDQASGPIVIDGDIYTPGLEPEATFADHVLVQDADSLGVADYGQVEVKLVGESTYRAWSRSRIPNVKLDADEFEKGKRIGGFEHLRLNNSLVGSIFREHIAHQVYRALDYPALRSSYAFLGSNVWGDGVWVPMTLIEVYKRRFCEDNAELLGGTCTNMWEFAGDLVQYGDVPGHPIPVDAIPVDPFPGPGGGGDQAGIPDHWCQLHECDNARLQAAIDALAAAPHGSGFQAALDPYVDWTLFHRFQCLSWMMWTGDDPIHGGNNNLILERDDGKLVWAPYSVDISAGNDWSTNVPLVGSTVLASGCQTEPSCWAETIASCEDLITRFDALDPETMVDATVAQLDGLGMLREGDQERAETLRAWFVWRQGELAGELERYRYLPDGEGNCPANMQRCEDDTCGSEAQCLERRCQLGQQFCDSVQRCVQTGVEECPSCDDAAKPVYCEFSLECVATEDDCAAACNAMADMEYCANLHACVPLGQCNIIID